MIVEPPLFSFSGRTFTAIVAFSKKKIVSRTWHPPADRTACPGQVFTAWIFLDRPIRILRVIRIGRTDRRVAIKSDREATALNGLTRRITWRLTFPLGSQLNAVNKWAKVHIWAHYNAAEEERQAVALKCQASLE